MQMLYFCCQRQTEWRNKTVILWPCAMCATHNREILKQPSTVTVAAKSKKNRNDHCGENKTFRSSFYLPGRRQNHQLHKGDCNWLLFVIPLFPSTGHHTWINALFWLQNAGLPSEMKQWCGITRATCYLMGINKGITQTDLRFLYSIQYN